MEIVKKEALGLTVWRTRFGRVYEPFQSHTTE